MKAKLLKATGEVVEIEPKNGTDFTLEELYAYLQCELVEIIVINKDDIMVIKDEEGKWANKGVNVNATKYAQENQVIAPWDYIVGHAIICNRKMVR